MNKIFALRNNSDLVKTMEKEIILLLRYNRYKRSNFIEAHQKIINEKGSVWMLKIGKRLPMISLQSIMDGSRTIILKAPKRDGGQFYKLDLIDFHNGDVLSSFCYPKYYEEMVEDENFWLLESLSGTWLKVNNIIQLSDADINSLRLVSNDKLAKDILNRSRSAVLYVYDANAF